MQKRSTGIILSYLKVAVNMVSGLVLSSALLRMLGDTEYGIYQTIAAFVNQLILLEFGVGTVMTRNISICRGMKSSDEEIQKNISTIWTMTGLLTMLVVVVSVAFYAAVPYIYAHSMTAEQIAHGQEIFVLVVGQLVCTFLMHTVNAVILSFENYTYGAVQSIIRTLLRTVLLLTLLLWWKNALIVAAVDFTLGFCCVLGSWIYCRKKLGIRLGFGGCDMSILKAGIPLALAVFLQGIVGQANNNVDKFIIGIMISPESVALYSVALYIYSVFCSLMNVPASMYIPTITQNVGRGLRGRELAKELVSPCRLTAFMGGLVVFGFAAVGRQFVQLLYGSEYLVAWPLALILMLPAYLDTVPAVMVNVLDAMNKRLARSAVLICTTVLNICLTIVWLQKWGVFGATLATGVCTLIGPVLIMNIYYKKALRIPSGWLYAQAFQGSLVYLLLACGAALGIGYLIENALVSFFVSGIAFVTIALGGYFCSGMKEEERKSIRRFLKKIPKKQ